MTATDQLLDKLVDQLREQDIAPFPREALTARLDNLSKQRAATPSAQRRFLRLRSWQLITAGSLAVGLAICIVAMLFALGSRNALAFADVKQAVDTTQTMSYRVLHYCNDPNYMRQYNLQAGEPAVSHMISAGDRFRNEEPLGMVSIVDFKKGQILAIWPLSRRAVLEPVNDKEEKMASDFRAMLRNVEASSAKKLPDRDMNGRTVSEFLIHVQDQDFRVTVDPQTKLPIRMEVVYAKNPDKGQISEVREVYTDFVFDAPVDEALFRLEPPAGYELENHVPRNDQPRPNESMALTVSPTEGIGPVKFGTKTAEIVQLLGAPDWRHDGHSEVSSTPVDKPVAGMLKMNWTELNYGRRGFELMSDDEHGLYSIHCFENRQGGSTVASFRGKTKEGISLGASLDDVLKTYGTPDAQLDSRQVWYPKLGYRRFEFRDKKLVSFQVMRPNPNIEVEAKGDLIIERMKVPAKK